MVFPLTGNKVKSCLNYAFYTDYSQLTEGSFAFVCCEITHRRWWWTSETTCCWMFRHQCSTAAERYTRTIASPVLLIWVLMGPNWIISIYLNVMRPLFPCYWCQWVMCLNVGTNNSCQDKCQPGPQCPSPSLWWWVYYTRFWKSLLSCLVRSGTAGALGKVWFPDRKGNVERWWPFPRKYEQLIGGCCKERFFFFFFLTM